MRFARYRGGGCDSLATALRGASSRLGNALMTTDDLHCDLSPVRIGLATLVLWSAKIDDFLSGVIGTAAAMLTHICQLILGKVV